MPVDLIHNVLRTAGREWPVFLDVCAGSLILQLESQVYRLRPLTWGDKRMLARYASMGEEFVRRYACLACATPSVWPQDTAEADALALAAATVTAPGGDDLPFSAGTLLRVTAEISHWIGTSLDGLDAQPAMDVEALWRVLARERVRAGSGARVEAPSADVWHGIGSPPEAVLHPYASVPLEAGWTRILVMPDPSPEQRVRATGEHEPDAAVSGVLESHPAGDMPPADARGFGPGFDRQKLSNGPPPAGLAGESASPTMANGPVAAVAQGVSPARRDDFTASAGEAAAEFVKAGAELPPEVGSTRQESPGNAGETGSGPAPVPGVRSTQPAIARQSGNRFRFTWGSDLPSGPPATPAPADFPIEDSALPLLQPREDPIVQSASHEPLLPRPWSSAGAEEVLDAFAEQLEMAAAAAGIDPEG